MTPRRQRWTLAAACFSQFMILLDTTVVNVALPSIQRELHADPGNLEWTINAYVLALASLILVGGTLGDRYGRRRMLVLGFAVFTAFSALCAVAASDDVLIAMRALQGAGAALMAPLALSVIVDAFPAERRAGAIAIWASVSGLGFAAGPIVGGLLLEAFDWSAIFWVNVPVGVAAIVVTHVSVRESRDPAARRLDLPGAALVSAGLFSLCFALVETEDEGWLSGRTLGFVVAAGLLLGAFVAVEGRRADPMLPLSFFRRRSFSAANASYALLYAAFAPTLFFVTLFFQNVKGYSALETGLSWLPLCLSFLVVAPFAGRVAGAVGARAAVVVGAVLGALGTLGLAALDLRSPYVLAVPAYLAIGVGYALAVPAVNAVALGAIERERAGLASGILNSFRQVGAAVGLAAVGSFATAIVTDRWDAKVAAVDPGQQAAARAATKTVAGGDGQQVADRLGRNLLDPAYDAFTSGMRGAMLAAGALVLLAALITLVASREPGTIQAPAAA